MRIYEVQARTPRLLETLSNIWKASVRATHLFLSDAEVNQIKKYVPQAFSEVEYLTVAADDSGKPIAFMGVTDKRLEMLFVAPEVRGTGIGKQLLLHQKTLQLLTKKNQLFAFVQDVLTSRKPDLHGRYFYVSL